MSAHQRLELLVVRNLPFVSTDYQEGCLILTPNTSQQRV